MAANGLLVAINGEWLVIVNKVVGAGVIYLLAMWQTRHGGSLKDIAVATGIGYLVAGLPSLIQVMGRYYQSKAELVFRVGLCYAPLAWCLGALRLSGWATQSSLDPLFGDWWRAIVRLGLFLVMMLPVIIYGNARTGLVGELKQMVATIGKRRG